MKFFYLFLFSMYPIILWDYPSVHPPIEDSQSYRLGGKYGLYIRNVDDLLEVNWISDRSEKGILRLTSTSGIHQEFTTSASIVHRVSFPAGKEALTIEFGNHDELSEVQIQAIVERAPYEIEELDSIYVLGDVHGRFNETVEILKNVGLIDDEHHWVGGGAHLVFLGDVFDRGPDAIRLLWFIYELESEAKESGGDVQYVLGNHEIMIMGNDDRYVSPKEKQIANLHQVRYQEMFDPKTTVLGKWLSSKPVILKMDRIIFAHGGLISNYGEYKIKAVNDSTYRFMMDSEFTQIGNSTIDSTLFSKKLWEHHRKYFYDIYGPLWFRGYAQSDTLGLYLDYVLSKYKADIHVIGHTIFPTITERYDAKIITTNLEEPASEMLLFVRKNKRNFQRFRVIRDGSVEKL